MKKGVFITFEGIDGCGKSTQRDKAVSFLQSHGIEPVITREPGGTKMSESIRHLVMSTDYGTVYDECEVLLYLAARAQHVAEVIIPALNEGKVILCDRFQEATLAYQGYGRGVDLTLLKELNRFSTKGLNPDLTIVFDISYAISRSRMEKMNKNPDRLEQNSEDFFQRVRTGYLAQAEQFPERFIVLDGEESIDTLSLSVQKALGAFIPQLQSTGL